MCLNVTAFQSHCVNLIFIRRLATQSSLNWINNKRIQKNSRKKYLANKWYWLLLLLLWVECDDPTPISAWRYPVWKAGWCFLSKHGRARPHSAAALSWEAGQTRDGGYITAAAEPSVHSNYVTASLMNNLEQIFLNKFLQTDITTALLCVVQWSGIMLPLRTWISTELEIRNYLRPADILSSPTFFLDNIL